MQLELATAATNMAPRGYKIAGYEIHHTNGSPMLSRGKGDKQETIRKAINRYAEDNDFIDFTLHLEDKNGEKSKLVTRYRRDDSGEAVPVPSK